MLSLDIKRYFLIEKKTYITDDLPSNLWFLCLSKPFAFFPRLLLKKLIILILTWKREKNTSCCLTFSSIYRKDILVPIFRIVTYRSMKNDWLLVQSKEEGKSWIERHSIIRVLKIFKKAKQENNKHWQNYIINFVVSFSFFWPLLSFYPSVCFFISSSLSSKHPLFYCFLYWSCSFTLTLFVFLWPFTTEFSFLLFCQVLSYSLSLTIICPSFV